MGKKAVPVARLKNDQNRRNTFKKRFIGLMKKVHDLSILCDAQIAIVVIDENKDIFPYTNNETIEEVWNQYLAKDKETKSNRLLENKKALETEIKKTETACHAKKKKKQDIPQNIGPHHNIPQNVGVLYGTFQNNGVHHQPNWSMNSNGPQYQICPRNTSSSMATNQERNNNNWSNDTDSVNHGNTNHVNEVYQTLYYETNGNNHQGYGYNVEAQGHDVQHQSQANLQDLALDCPIDENDNHQRYDYNVEVQGHEVFYQSQTLLQDPLDCPIDVDAFEKANLVCASLNVKSSDSKASGVTESIPSPRDLNIAATSTPSIMPSILSRGDPSTKPPTQEDALCTRPLTSVEWELMEDWKDLDLDDLDLEDLGDIENMENKEDIEDMEDKEDTEGP